MSSAPTPTLSRSQRWLVLLTLVVLTIAGIWWWTWPRIDSRERAVARIRQHIERQDFEAARGELLKLNEAQPHDAEVLQTLADLAFRRNRSVEGIEWLEKLAPATGVQRAEALFDLAQKAMSAGLATRTEQLLREMLRLRPSHKPARDQLIRLLWLTRQDSLLRDAIAEQDRTRLNNEPLDPQTLLLYCVGSRFDFVEDDHLAWLQAGMTADPTDSVARAALADYLILRNRREEARKLLPQDLASRENTLIFSARDWRLAVIAAEDSFANGDTLECDRRLRSLPNEANRESRVWLLRGRLWSEQNDLSAADIAFTNAARLDPFDPAVANEHARIAQKLGEADTAKSLFARAQNLAGVMMLATKSLQASSLTSEALSEIGTLCGELQQPRLAMLFQQSANAAGSLSEKSVAKEASVALTAPSHVVLATPKNISLPADARPVPETEASEPHSNAPLFVDVAESAQLDFVDQHAQSQFHWLMETLGGGVTVLDFDNDQWPDLFFTQGSPLPIPSIARESSTSDKTHRLFRNVNGQRFEDVTAAAQVGHFGYGQGCVSTDYDNDGFADLLTCHYGEVVLFRNNGDGTLTDVTRACGLQDDAWSTSAAWGDFDRDGDLDLYVVHYVQAPFKTLKPCGQAGNYETCRPHDYSAEQDSIWENLGDGQFADRTSDSGIIVPDGKGLGVLVRDFDQDGWPDIYVGNDTTANFLFHNRGRTTDANAAPFSFQEIGQIAGVAFDGNGLPEASMGLSGGDVDGDGRFDLFVTNFQDETNTFYRQVDDGLIFSDQTDRAGLTDASRQIMGWGCQFLDADGDGWLDLFVANGHLIEPPQLPQFFRNRGRGKFQLEPAASAYFQHERMGRSAAILDWNGDLRPDIVVSHLNDRASLLENRSNSQFLELRLIGTASNRTAESAVVVLEDGAGMRVFSVSAGGGYFSGNELSVRVGVSASTKPSRLTIRWPSGVSQTITDIRTRRQTVIEK